jgi:hypothetical protein
MSDLTCSLSGKASNLGLVVLIPGVIRLAWPWCWQNGNPACHADYSHRGSHKAHGAASTWPATSEYANGEAHVGHVALHAALEGRQQRTEHAGTRER